MSKVYQKKNLHCNEGLKIFTYLAKVHKSDFTCYRNIVIIDEKQKLIWIKKEREKQIEVRYEGERKNNQI